MPLKDKLYDTLRYIANYILPGLGTLYFTLGQIWSLPYGEQIVGTTAALTIFCNSLLGLSKSAYNKIEAVKAEYESRVE